MVIGAHPHAAAGDAVFHRARLDAPLACHKHPTLPPEAWEVALHGARDHQALNIAAAKVCTRCPLRDACLADGLKQGADAVGLIMGGHAIAGHRNNGVRAVDPITCAWCRREFFHVRAGRVAYCSKRCCDLASATPEGAERGTCGICGSHFNPTGNNQRYCGAWCVRVAKSQRANARQQTARDLVAVA